MLMELPQGIGGKVNHIVRWKIFHLYGDISSEKNSETLEIICLVYFMLYFILYAIKTLFELALGISKMTNFLEMGHLLATLIFAIFTVLAQVFKQSLNTKLWQSDGYL